MSCAVEVFKILNLNLDSYDGGEEEAIDYVYSVLMTEKSLLSPELVNQEIFEFVLLVRRLPLSVLLSVLTAVLPIRSKLPEYRRLYNEIKKIYYEPGLLTGLEPI